MISAAEAAEILGVSRNTLTRLIRDGVVPAPPTNPLLKRPRRYVFNRADIEALKQRPSPAPPAPGSGVKREE